MHEHEDDDCEITVYGDWDDDDLAVAECAPPGGEA